MFSAYAFIDDRKEQGKRCNNSRIREIEKIAQSYGKIDYNELEIEKMVNRCIFGDRRSIFVLLKGELQYILNERRNI